MGQIRKTSNVSGVEVCLAFIEHDSVPVCLVQNTPVLVLSRQSGIGGKHNVEAVQITK